VSTGGPDLFVICNSCGSEVSPYITECPYCGNRLRKRAPKLDRDQRPAEKRRARRTPPPILSRLRPGEIPGIRADRHPYATIALVLAGFVGCLLWRTGVGGQASNLIVIGKLSDGQWWRLFTAAFAYDNTGYAIVSLGAIALFGWLLERRHGPLVPLGLFVLAGVGGLAATAVVDSFPIVLGAGGGALAMVCAWAVPDVIEYSRTGDVDGDLLGAAVIAAAIALMPLADPQASWIADVVGVGVGTLIGLPLARTAAAR
jgi:membrane associated rhomboid family serine protease